MTLCCEAMFWDIIIYGRRTALAHVPLTITGQIYMDIIIIRPIVQSILEEVGLSFIFMDDYAPPHQIQAEIE